MALTLGKLGYKEVRTRDALLRMTGASGMLSEALGTANTAWSEKNVALTNEAALRYGTNASKLQILKKNQAVATGISFGNAMTPPHLGKGEWGLSILLKGFGKMDDGQKNMASPQRRWWLE